MPLSLQNDEQDEETAMLLLPEKNSVDPKFTFRTFLSSKMSKFQLIEDIFKGESSRFCFVLFCQCGGKCNTGRKYKERCQNLASQLQTGRRITQDPKTIQNCFHLVFKRGSDFGMTGVTAAEADWCVCRKLQRLLP